MTSRRSYPQMRGIEAFLSVPDSATPLMPAAGSTAPEQATAISVSIAAIQLPQRQPRKTFDDRKMNQLIQSVQQHGILEPLIVRSLNGKQENESAAIAQSGSSETAQFELIAGERRYRAARALSLSEVPVVVRQLDDREAWELALVENLQREDLNPVEETEGLLELAALSEGLSQAEVIALLNHVANAKRRGAELTDNVVRQFTAIEQLFAQASGISAESFRTHRLPLLNLPEDLLNHIRQGQLSYTKAKAIARIQDDVQRQSLANEAIEQSLSLNAIKQRIAAAQSRSPQQAHSTKIQEADTIGISAEISAGSQPSANYRPSLNAALNTTSQEMDLKQSFWQVAQQLYASNCWMAEPNHDRLVNLIQDMKQLLQNERSTP